MLDDIGLPASKESESDSRLTFKFQGEYNMDSSYWLRGSKSVGGRASMNDE